MLNQEQIREFEDKMLAGYAAKSYESRGRTYKEKEHAYRSAYQRDRDRIIHSAAFRRLEYKTQVFVFHEGDYYRTRLTHTLEVAQIARTIAYALRLNIDLVEAIALAHDLGHTAFGHSGEDALNELMQQYGGFNHNLQGLRVVDVLEERYPEFPGLNLSWEVREGIVKHSSAFDRAACIPELAPDELPTLETQVVDIADEIAYDNHDLDDGLTSGMIKEQDLDNIALWHEVNKKISQKYSGLDEEKRKYVNIRSLIDIQVTDLIRETSDRLENLGVKTCGQVRAHGEKIVSFSPRMFEMRNPLRDFLMRNLYGHYRVIRMSNKARRFLKRMFNVYVDNPEQLPPHIHKRVGSDGVYRVVCDYISGMTDRYALNEYAKLFYPYEKV